MNLFDPATTIERRLISKASEARQPVNGSIELLTLCNKNCRICYVRLSREEMEAVAQVHVHALPFEFSREAFQVYIADTLERAVHMEEKEAVSEGMSCLAGKCSFTVNWQGMMCPCVIMSSPEISVFGAGFEKAWKYIVEETDKIFLNSKCSDCKYRPTCQTRAACALSESGSYDGIPEYMCRYAGEIIHLLKDIQINQNA